MAVAIAIEDDAAAALVMGEGGGGGHSSSSSPSRSRSLLKDRPLAIRRCELLSSELLVLLIFDDEGGDNSVTENE
jgi:hypothetical protein